jgi:hypothetical protein
MRFNWVEDSPTSSGFAAIGNAQSWAWAGGVSIAPAKANDASPTAATAIIFMAFLPACFAGAYAARTQSSGFVA